MGAVVNLTGKKFGSLLVVEPAGSLIVNGRSKGRQWNVVCDCGNELVVSVSNLQNGNSKSCGRCDSVRIRKELVGSTMQSAQCGDFTVLEYTSSARVKVRFTATGYETTTDLNSVRLGSIRDPFSPKASGVGYFGVGPYPSRDSSGKNSEAYEVWLGIMKRCYNTEWQEKQGRTSYRDCTVDSTWHNFQVFAEWYYSQPHVGKGLHVDKDLLVEGNRVYGPSFCTLVPVEVNSLFTGSNKFLSDNGLPVGIHFCKDKCKYIAQIQRGELTKGGKSKQSYLGQYDTIEEAVAAYTKAKKKRVSEVAEKFKHLLDERVYTNLLNYANKEN